MIDYEPFAELVQFMEDSGPLDQLLQEVRGPGIFAVASALRDNVRRLALFLRLPILIAAHTKNDVEIAERAQRIYSERAMDAWTEGRQRPTADDYLAIREAVAREHRQLLGGDKEGLDFVFGTAHVTTHASLDPRLGSALGILGELLLVNTWTAFEALSVDLWEKALNAHPKLLSDLKGRRRTKPDKSEESEQDQKKAEKLMRWDRFQQYDYNLSNRMGTLLKGRFNFTILAGIREAYELAFSEHYKAIDDALGDPAIDELAAARNLFVHKAGMVDGPFLRKTGKLPHFKDTAKYGITLESKLAIDPQLGKSLVTPVIERCADLVRAVSNWIIAH